MNRLLPAKQEDTAALQDRLTGALIGIAGAANYNPENLWNADEDIRCLKFLILFGIRGVAAYAWHAAVLG